MAPEVAPPPPPPPAEPDVPAVEDPAPPSEVPSAAAVHAPIEPPQRATAPNRALRPAAAVSAPAAAMPAPAEVDAPVPASGEFATIEIRTNYPADVYVDDQKRGETRQPGPIAIPPGKHDVVIRGEFLVDHRIAVDLEPGQAWSPGEVLELVPRPATVELDVAFPGDCMIAVDGQDIGMIADAGRLVRVDRPERPHTVVVRCGDTRYARTYADLMIVRRSTLPMSEGTASP